MDILENVFKEAKAFNPKFTWSDNLDAVVDAINLPHEDYPLRVQKTKELIQMYIDNGITCIYERDLKSIHGHLFSGEGFNDKHIVRGDYRKINVSVGNFVPPDPLDIQWLMDGAGIVPVGGLTKGPDDPSKIYRIQEMEDIIWWYKKFETIHPFQDGNGRVGGIIVAYLSFMNFKKFLMPNRE